MAQIIGLLNTVGALVKLINQLLDFIKKNKEETWLRDLSYSVQLMARAETPEEKKRAIISVARSWSNIPR